MFTINVQNHESRTVYECGAYQVRHGDDGAATITLEGAVVPDQRVDVPHGSIAFVMNAAGATVDIVRPKRGGATASMRATAGS